MPKQLSESSVIVHTLPQELLEQPLTERFEVALQHWLDLYPETISLRYGNDHASKRVFLAENMYGPRLYVMNQNESYAALAKCEGRVGDSEHAPSNIAKRYGVGLKDWMSSDPSVQLFHTNTPQLQKQFNKELAVALNVGLREIGCISHKVAVSDNGLQWVARDKFASSLPPVQVFEALVEFFKDEHPVTTHVVLGPNIEVKSLSHGPWVPMDQTVVEREFFKAKKELADPTHPWVVARASTDKHIEGGAQTMDPMILAYMESQNSIPISRNSSLLFRGDRFDDKSDTSVGYVILGTESCGTAGIERHMNEIMEMAEKSQLTPLSFNFEKCSDVLMSMAYHKQVAAHQKERSAWAQKHPQAVDAGAGQLMPKSVKDLDVGDLVGLQNKDAAFPSLWCEVTKRDGDILTLFVNNGHWDFQLDATTNKTLAHDIIKDFEGQVEVTYTAPIPIKDPALYNEALKYMQEHTLEQNTAKLTSSPF